MVAKKPAPKKRSRAAPKSNRASLAKKPKASGRSVPNLQTATFACGCFWGVQQAFDSVRGVVSTRVG